MARVIPAHPVYGHPTEEKVVDLLRDQLSDDSDLQYDLFIK